MELVFSQQNRFEVSAMRAYLESHGIPSFLKNEFTSSVMGEVPFLETWPELWVSDDLYEAARQLIDDLQAPAVELADWPCLVCNESSPGTFDFCWCCGEVRKAT